MNSSDEQRSPRSTRHRGCRSIGRVREEIVVTAGAAGVAARVALSCVCGVWRRPPPRWFVRNGCVVARGESCVCVRADLGASPHSLTRHSREGKPLQLEARR